MADTKITALTAISTVDPAVDVLPIVDVSDTTMAASGTTKKITSNQILGAGGTATLASATISGAATAARLIVTGSTIPANGIYLPAANTVGFAANSLDQYRIEPLGVFTWYDGAGGTRMTLNSTGLGVGGSPVNPITAYAAASAKAPALLLTTAGSPTYGWDFSVDGAVNGNLFIRSLVAGTKTDVLEFDRATGNVGVGVTPSVYRLSIATPGELFGSYTKTVASLATEEVVFARCFSRNTNDAGTYNLGGLSLVREDGAFGVRSSFKLVLKNGGGSGGQFEAARITSDGNLLVGDTSSPLASRLSLFTTFAQPDGIVIRNTGATAGLYWRFGAVNNSNTLFVMNASSVGVTMADGASAWSAVSDERLKDIIEPISNAVSKIGSLRSVIGKYKSDADGMRRSFLIAQDVKSVLPEAVDSTDVESLGLRYTEVIPLLVAAIKELTARVEALEA